MDIDSKDVQLTSNLGRAQQTRLDEGKSLLRTNLEGSRDVAVGVFSLGIVPAVQQHVHLAQAYQQGRITIDQYDEALSEMAGGQTAAAVLGSVGAKASGKTWTGRAVTVTEQSSFANLTPQAAELAEYARHMDALGDVAPTGASLPIAGAGLATTPLPGEPGFIGPTPTLGGAHRATKVGGTQFGTESHHLIADAASDLATEAAPAIRLPVPEHRLTSSHGSRGLVAKAFRQAQEALVKQGKYDEALKMGLDDVRQLPNAQAHEPAIQQMLERLPRGEDGAVDWTQIPKKKN
jgi:hypothetical protein